MSRRRRRYHDHHISASEALDMADSMGLPDGAAMAMAALGWTQKSIREFLWEHSKIPMAQLKRGGVSLGNIDVHPQQCGRKRLTLCIGHQTASAAAAETFVKEKVERIKIWQLETFDFAFDDLAEMFLDRVGGHFANEERIVFFF